MKFIAKLIVAIAVVGTAVATGYWWGNNQSSATARNDSSGISTGKKILYYRHPMGLPDTSPAPKKDSMGMDYLPVYEGEGPVSDQTAVKINTEKIQKLGIRTEAAELRELIRTVRAVATIQPDEGLLSTLTPKFEGWIQRLYVNTTGQVVKKGEALMNVYSPELITGQHEYLIAMKGKHGVANGGLEAGASMERLAESALQRLRHWDISGIELKCLQQEGEIREYITLRSKANGLVLEKPSIEGKRFMPGEVLYQIADLSTVWILADVFEQDIGLIQPNQKTTVRVDAYPDKIFNGKVDFVYPTVTPETRNAIVRIKLTNPAGLLKPAMYARVEFASSSNKDKVLTVPDSAILNTGTRQVVLVDLGAGRFEPRAVKLGMHADGYVEVLSGLQAGEKVVVKANFLIDAESNFSSALSSFAQKTPNSITSEQRIELSPQAEKSSHITHRGEGTIKAIDFAQAKITLAHGPLESLQWPPMIMDFRLVRSTLSKSLKPGQKIIFEIAERKAGEFVIVHVQPADIKDQGRY